MRWRRRPQPTIEVLPPEHLWKDVVDLVSALDERDRARDMAVALECENARLLDTLRELRAACEPHAPLITLDDIAERVDAALKVT